MKFSASIILFCASVAFALPLATPEAARALEIRQGGGCLPGHDGLGIGRCYKERGMAAPAAKVETLQARQHTPCGPDERQDGGLGHTRCYKEQDVIGSVAV